MAFPREVSRFLGTACRAGTGPVRQAGDLLRGHEVLEHPGRSARRFDIDPSWIRIIGVKGKRLDESEQDSNQDFVMVNGPNFNASTPKPFIRA
jgi:hypothetical protein